MSLCELSEQPLLVERAVQSVSLPEAGAVSLFLGTVRDHNDGRRVTRLDYEAYPAMALKEMRRICEQIAQESPGVRLCCLHRVGALRVGDLAVVCAASAAHREQAFWACHALIDRIKEQVPIWKREHGPDGPYWVGWQGPGASGHPVSGS
jgi:molybdopterin synthase catalytic subunit